jgi:hypothetical protein
LLNGDAHHSEIEGELRYASDPLPYFQRLERAHDTRPRAALHGAMTSHRILYAGDDIYLPSRLRNSLIGVDCFVVRSPVDSARTLIRSDIKYSLLLFDETEAGAGLERYARTLAHREQAPVMLIKKAEAINSLVNVLARLLSG